MKSKIKIVAVTAIIVLLLAIPLTVALTQQTRNVHVDGTARYPSTSVNPTTVPTPTVIPTLSFSLWFPNGTIMPITTTLIIVPTIVSAIPVGAVIDDTPAKDPPSICYVRNDGTVPINITAKFGNIVIPSNYMNCLFFIRYFVGIDDGTALASRQYPGASTSGEVTVQPNSELSIEVDLVFYPRTDVSQSYTPGALFNYSFDLAIAATQA
jgi:hypothetical protein